MASGKSRVLPRDFSVPGLPSRDGIHCCGVTFGSTEMFSNLFNASVCRIRPLISAKPY